MRLQHLCLLLLLLDQRRDRHHMIQRMKQLQHRQQQQ
jgi:hypothetical protein